MNGASALFTAATAFILAVSVLLIVWRSKRP
jgi:hypothetical protein